MTLTYKKGDLFADLQDRDVIVHVVNNIGIIGGGFTAPLIKRFPAVRECYVTWKPGKMPYPYTCSAPTLSLGHIQTVTAWLDEPAGTMVDVINMCAQYGVISQDNPHPLSYSHLELCMSRIANSLSMAKIKCPMFGAGLAGGDWLKIEQMIKNIWHMFDVTVYQL